MNNDLMQMLQLMMLMKPSQVQNPYQKNRTGAVLGDLLGRIGGPLALEKLFGGKSQVRPEDMAGPSIPTGMMQPRGGPVTPQGQPRSQEEILRMLMQLMGMGGQMGRMPF